MSSNRRRLRFHRPLCGVSIVAAAADADGLGHVSPQQLAELRRTEAALEHREQELSRGQAQLAEQMALAQQTSARLSELVAAVQREQAQMLEANEETLVAFCLSITKKVLQHEIENGRYKIGEIVKAALEAVRASGSIVVRVNPQDRGLTEAAMQEMRQAPDGKRISVQPDDSVPPAACRIETESGWAMSDVDSRLERIEESLLKGKPQSNGV